MPEPTISPSPFSFRWFRGLTPSARGRWGIKAGCLAGLSALALAIGVEVYHVVFGQNLHTVVPGRVYRSAQLSAADLEQTLRRHAIRTVVNLRGCSVPSAWYLDECRTTHALNVNQEDIFLSAGRLPASDELCRLVEVLDQSEYPLLLHCRQGADRTGLASAVVLLLHSDLALGQARRQLGLRYGHVSLDHAAYLDWFFDLYSEWLASQGKTHTPASFRQWAEHEYCAGFCRCTFEPLQVPRTVPRDTPAALRFRVRNTSVRNWHFRQESNVGIHICFVLRDAWDQGVATGRFGLFEREVPSGASIDLAVVLPAVGKPGRYRCLVDMVDEQHCWFYQTGSEPWEGELTVQ
jgi:hypothetical protein